MNCRCDNYQAVSIIKNDFIWVILMLPNDFLSNDLFAVFTFLMTLNCFYFFYIN